MTCVRWTFLALAVAWPVAVARMVAAAPADDPRRAQVQAAMEDATDALRREVVTASITPDLTVADFLERTGGTDHLDDALRTAQQPGGTRWIDDQCCIIRLEIPGDAVADAIIAIAKAEPEKCPVEPASLDQRLEKWRGRIFAAEGSSTGAKYAVNLRPAEENPAWRNVSGRAVHQAVDAARSNAVQRVLDSLNDVELADGRTVADALRIPSVREAVQGWLAQRPVTDVQFRDEVEVELTVSAPADGLWEVFRQSLNDQTEIPKPGTDEQWAELRERVFKNVARAVGRAAPPKQGDDAPPVRQADVLPDVPPRWTRDVMDAPGTARRAADKLMTKKRAEDDALRALRRRIEALPLKPGRTLGEAAAQDPEIAAAIDRSIRLAEPYRVKYRDDGGVDVRYTLDLRRLWFELTSR